MKETTNVSKEFKLGLKAGISHTRKEIIELIKGNMCDNPGCSDCEHLLDIIKQIEESK